MRMDIKEIMLTARRYSNEYKADIMAMLGIELSFLSSMENDPLLWHRRFGHASLKQLNILSSKDMVLGLPKTKFKKEKVCSSCVKEKQEKSSFKSKNHVSKSKIYMNLCGPMKL